MTVAADDPRPELAVDSAADALIERRLAGQQVYAGVLLDVRRDRVRLPDGSEAVREYIVHPGAVLMVPALDDGAFIAVRQFRYPQNRAFLEFPAGTVSSIRSSRIRPRRSRSMLRGAFVTSARSSTRANSSTSCAAPKRISTRHKTAADSPTRRPSQRSRCIRAG